MIIVYINCSLFPFVDWIIQGLKVYETRNKNTLKNLVGKTVYIAQTGKRKTVIRCKCNITGSVFVTDKPTYNRYRKQTMIIPGSHFDWNSKTKQKVLYKLENDQSVNPYPVPGNVVKHGRIYYETV